jgi:hypothetical protein
MSEEESTASGFLNFFSHLGQAKVKQTKSSINTLF